MGCTCDVNKLFAYKSVRSVRVEDYRLGLTYYMFIVGIIIYVAIYNLIYSNRALLAVVPQGTIRMQLQAPVVDNCASPAYHNTCENDFTPVTDLPYCSQSNQSTFPPDQRWPYPRFPCTYRDGPGMSGSVQNGAIYAATRISTYHQKNVCGPELQSGKSDCSKIWMVDSNKTEFVADVERFTLLIDPNAEVNGIIEGNDFEVSAPASRTDSRIFSGKPDPTWWDKLWDPQMPSNPYAEDLCQEYIKKGQAYSTQLGNSKATSAPCYIKTNRTSQNLDVMTMDTLLRASGLTLSKGAVNGHSTLYMGTIIVVELEYADHGKWLRKLTNPMVTYKMTWLDKSKFKEDKIVWYNEDRSQRVLEDRHGVWLVGVITGSFYSFFLMNFFVQCTTFVSFISLATITVDLIMQYLTGDNKERYKAGKITTISRLDGDSDDETGVVGIDNTSEKKINGNGGYAGIECGDLEESLIGEKSNN